MRTFSRKEALDIYHSGKILQKSEQAKKAIELYKQALITEPYFVEALYNLGNCFVLLNKPEPGMRSFRLALEINPSHPYILINLANIYQEENNLSLAEVYTRKAIEAHPLLASAHANMGGILQKLGRLKDAQISLVKAIDLDKRLAKAHYLLSNQPDYYSEPKSQAQLLNINENSYNRVNDVIDICFAKSNVLHLQRRFNESARYLVEANNKKLSISPSNHQEFIDENNEIAKSLKKCSPRNKEPLKEVTSIFIVGMPRSGSTLVESILSSNSKITDLGETSILKESITEWLNLNNASCMFSNVYKKNIKVLEESYEVTTDKNLTNYTYAEFIAKNFPEARIIYCARHPLDNILSIYRSHFAKGWNFSCSIIGTAKVLLHQSEMMVKNLREYPDSIYQINYEQLVMKPEDNIRSLIHWLGLEWHEFYLRPHLNPREIHTASSVQVRREINTKSINGWKNYRGVLEPAGDLISRSKVIKELFPLKDLNSNLNMNIV